MTTARKKKHGTVTFVGGGPGDPSLLTLRGAEAIADAHVVVLDPDLHGQLRQAASDVGIGTGSDHGSPGQGGRPPHRADPARKTPARKTPARKTPARKAPAWTAPGRAPGSSPCPSTR